MRKILWILPNKCKKNSGIFKYNIELIKLVKKKSNVEIIYTGTINNYFFTFFYKFIFFPLYLIFKSNKFNCVVFPEEGFAFLKVFSYSDQNKIIIHDFRKVFNDKNRIKIIEFLKQLYLNFNFKFIHKFNKIIVPSLFTKNLLKKYAVLELQKIDIIPNIINFRKKIQNHNKKLNFLKEDCKDSITVMCVTSNETRKNINFLSHVANYSKNIKFIIVGNIQIKKFKNNTYNFKNISEKDLIYLFNISDIFLDVSLFEGFGRTLIEAQYFGLKVISFNTKINKKILENSGTYINKNFSIKKINSILKKKLLKKNRIKYFKNALNFSTEKINYKYKNEINEI